MIKDRPPNFIDAETNAGGRIYKHVNHSVWLYPSETTYSVYMIRNYDPDGFNGRLHTLTKEEYEGLLLVLDMI